MFVYFDVWRPSEDIRQYKKRRENKRKKGLGSLCLIKMAAPFNVYSKAEPISRDLLISYHVFFVCFVLFIFSSLRGNPPLIFRKNQFCDFIFFDTLKYVDSKNKFILMNIFMQISNISNLIRVLQIYTVSNAHSNAEYPLKKHVLPAILTKYGRWVVLCGFLID